MRFITPNILFLDEDMEKSAQSLANRFIEKQIKNCSQILVCSLLYNVGIRSRKAHKYYFSKEHKKESLNKFFPDWTEKEAPKFLFYTSPEAKWCRMCKNHYDVILEYLRHLHNEYEYRFNKEHPLYDLYDFLKLEPVKLSLRTGVRVVYVDNLKIVLPWKNLPLQYRKKNIVEGYRMYYKNQLMDIGFEYDNSKRDIPEWLFEKVNDPNEI